MSFTFLFNSLLTQLFLVLLFVSKFIFSSFYYCIQYSITPPFPSLHFSFVQLSPRFDCMAFIRTAAVSKPYVIHILESLPANPIFAKSDEGTANAARQQANIFHACSNKIPFITKQSQIKAFQSISNSSLYDKSSF